MHIHIYTQVDIYICNYSYSRACTRRVPYKYEFKKKFARRELLIPIMLFMKNVYIYT